MEDKLAGIRQKTRFVTEVRYPVVPEFLDKRGHIIAALHPTIREQFKHWTSNPNEILFTDAESTPSAEFYISPKRASLVLEDPGSTQRFLDLALKWAELVYKSLGPQITEIGRFGVRFLEVLKLERARSYTDVLEMVLSAFHTAPALGSLRPTDSLVKIVHEHGFYQVGPTKIDDQWPKVVFKRPDQNMPKFGVAMDIDSFQTNLAVSSAKDVQAAFRAVFAVTLSVEDAICHRLELTPSHVPA